MVAWKKSDQDDTHNKLNLINQAECELAFEEQREDGLALFTLIGGYSGSSTRTELAAAIVAISADGPVHVGSDSKAFVSRARKLQRNLANGRAAKKQWKLISDGDLWEHFYKALQTKGPNSFRATWVKGHATEDHVNKGVTTNQDRIGNDHADKIADMGAKLHGEDFAKSAKAIGFRHQRYTKLVTNVAKHIIEASLINSELNRRRDEVEKAKKAKEDRGENYIELQYPNTSEARQITPKAALSNYNVFNISNPKHAQAEKFPSNLCIEDCKD